MPEESWDHVAFAQDEPPVEGESSRAEVELPGIEPEPEPEPRKSLIWVRATIHLPGLRAGDVAQIDPDDEYMKGCLGANFLLRISAPDDV